MQALPLNRSAAELPAPSDDARRHSDRLVEEVRAEIQRHGWISFSRYMEMALYAPGLGYYVAGAAKLGSEGDFVTAPEISPLFGGALADQVADILAHTGGGLLELGAGSGALALSLLEELQARDRLPERYRILELSPELVQRQRWLLLQRLPGLSDRIEWITSLPQRFTGVVVANEVLDALPVHLLGWREDGARERGVTWKGEGFAWAERSLVPGALRDAAAALQIEAPYQSEVSIAAAALVRTLAGVLDRGVLLCVDYGFGRREYYHPQRNRGTLMCHYRHRAHDDPFLFPGLQDITAHVDFTSLAEAGIEAGLQLLGYTTQAQFLINCGIADLLARTPTGQTTAYLPLATGVQKLVSPAEMGELFKVIALGRGVEPPLAGFRTGDKCRLL
ncbi:MAG TPA: SAM-dependent methyltransferase [Burkholderiales bacterium]|nr:SAM-dependent methyltransferase [Burkholderiales bacterium]